MRSPKVVKEDEHRFILYLMEIFHKLPSDPFFEEMDPVERLYLFYSWANKNNVNIELMKDQAILIGSFTDPERAKNMIKGPDFSSSDDEFDASFEYVRSQPFPDALNDIKEGNASHRRRRRRVVE